MEEVEGKNDIEQIGSDLSSEEIKRINVKMKEILKDKYDNDPSYTLDAWEDAFELMLESEEKSKKVADYTTEISESGEPYTETYTYDTGQPDMTDQGMRGYSSEIRHEAGDTSIWAREEERHTETSYSSLNDTAVYLPALKGLEAGDTEIYYAIELPVYIDEELNISVSDIKDSDKYKLLGEIKEKDLDAIYSLLQSEIWSPLGEAKELVRSKGLKHTSMSIGDVVRSGGIYYFVSPTGFTVIKDSKR